MPYADKEKLREYKNEWKRKKRLARGLQKAGRKPLTEEEKLVSKEKTKIYQREWKKKYNQYNPVKRLLWAAKKRAKQRGLAFDLEEQDIIIPELCPFLHIPLANSRPRGDARRDIASLDRIDPSKGYTKDNIQVISWLANSMKSNATPEELIAFAEEVLKRYKTCV